MMMLKFLATFGFLSLVVTPITGQNKSNFRQPAEFPFVLVSDSGAVAPVISDSLFDQASRGIRFRVNKTYLIKDQPFISLYNDSLLSWANDNNLRLSKVYIRGAASPEGPYDNNKYLGKARAARLVEFLDRDGSLKKANEVLSSGINEDYAYLITLMKEANDPGYPEVEAMWNACGHSEPKMKMRLMQAYKGKLWKRLLDQYFPILRQARVMLWYTTRYNLHIGNLGQLYPHMLLTDLPDLQVPRSDRSPKYARRHLIALRTNLLHDFFYMPNFGKAFGMNVQLEYYPLTGHYTYNAGFTYTNHRHWEDYQFFQIRDLRLELRRYFVGGGEFIGPFLSAYANGTFYGIGLSQTKGWEGEGGGAGIGIGYTCKLNRKGSLRLEFNAEFGGFYTEYDPYIYGNPITGTKDGLYYYDYYGKASDFKERQHSRLWLGPTNAGIHLTYDIIYRKKKQIR